MMSHDVENVMFVYSDFLKWRASFFQIMNIYAKLTGLVFIPTAFLVSCGSFAERINQKRQKHAEIVANDLRQMKLKSKYYRESAAWIEVNNNVRVKTKGGWEVAFYTWPIGPFKVLDIETNHWHFEE